MKSIKIKEMRLLNFKCFADYRINFDGRDTMISGRNGTGKTAIFDAFTWLLFGKSADGRKEFNLKTICADGKVIENIPHEVSAVIMVDGEEISLARKLTEKWTKKRGSSIPEFSGNVEERIFNDVPLSVKEWQEAIANICDEQIFKFITNPLYFTSQKPDVQRAMLLTMAGDITPEEVAGDNEEFKDLLRQLDGKPLEHYKRELLAKKKRLRGEIAEIPGRVDECRRAFPDIPNWQGLRARLSELQREKSSLTNQLADFAKAHEAANAERMEKVERVFALKQKKSALESGIRSSMTERHQQLLRDKKNVAAEIGRLRGEIDNHKAAVDANAAEISVLADKRDTLLSEWREIKDSALAIGDDFTICPLCGREREPGDIEARIREAQERFNKEKAERLKDNHRKGTLVVGQIATLSEKNDMLAEEIKQKQGLVEQHELQLANILIASVDEIKVEIEQAIASDGEIHALAKQIASLEEEVSAAPMLDNGALRQAMVDVDNAIYDVNAELAKKDLIDNNNARILDLEFQLRRLSDELARLEGVEFTIAAFSKAMTNMVDSRVNGLFDIVKFKLFKEQINGAEIETCEATVDGVPFSDLNNANKINAGLDIINAICKSQNTCAPIFIDNAESANDLRATASQQIRLYVSTDGLLTIKHINN